MTSEKKLIRADGSEEELPSKVENVAVQPGDKLLFSTAGGGGLGDPLERPPEQVATEVQRGLVSETAAHEEYGVVLDGEGVDEAATEERRAEIRADRDDPETFDYGPLPDDEELAEHIAAERAEFEDRHN
jgi:N-methylhydantoinase B